MSFSLLVEWCDALAMVCHDKCHTVEEATVLHNFSGHLQFNQGSVAVPWRYLVTDEPMNGPCFIFLQSHSAGPNVGTSVNQVLKGQPRSPGVERETAAKFVSFISSVKKDKRKKKKKERKKHTRNLLCMERLTHFDDHNTTHTPN